MKLTLYVQPGAKKSGYSGKYGDLHKIKISALPSENAANDKLVDFISKLLSIPKDKITIVSGLKSRRKTLEIKADITEAEVEAALEQNTE